jgi:hypothetical protein
MLVPVMPLPMMTTSAAFGRSRVERWPSNRRDGSLCQNDLDESSLGRLQGPRCEGSVGPG